MSVSDYSTSPDLNTSISSINIAEGCLPGNLNNAIRQLMADVKTEHNTITEAISQAKTDLEEELSDFEATVNKSTFVGEIKLWSGTLDNGHPVVSGTTMTSWQLCDGTNGTPNLADRFVLGASASTIGVKGGSATHNHTISGTITIDATTLTTAQMPSHNHSQSMSDASGGGCADDAGWGGWYYGSGTSSTGGSGSHTHTASSGLSTADKEVLPPYYKLAYIMRIA